MDGNAENGPGAMDILAAWREQGADRLDPVRFHFMEALARRADTQGGHARRVLDEKLSLLLDAYKSDLAAASNRDVASSVATPADANSANATEPGTDAAPIPADAVAPSTDAVGASAASGRETLAALLESLAVQMRARASGSDIAATGAQPVYPEMALLDYFRDTWSRYSAKSQLRQSQQRVPENAGPLNSSLLVHRMLSLMGEVSPEYLQHFLSYVDALAWTELATTGDLLLSKDGQRAGGAKKSGRSGSK